jgi:hypothetical protein
VNTFGESTLGDRSSGMNTIIEPPDRRSNHIRDMRRYVADVAITASALRNQGGPGFVLAARVFLPNLDFGALKKIETTEIPELVGNSDPNTRGKAPNQPMGSC